MMGKKRLASFLLAGCCACYAADAMAEDTVAVMKLDALGSKVDQESSMVLESLRDVVMSTPNLVLDANGGDITYTEMQMVTGCDRDASIACYDAACETLGAPAIIFGSIKDGGETHLVWYVSGKGIFRETTGVVTDKESADKLAKSIIVGDVGSVIVTSNVPGADVFIDGKRVGMSAEFKENAQPIELVTGNYVIAVRKDGYNKEDAQKITIEKGVTSYVHVDMTVAQDPEAIAKGVRIAGFVTGGVGIASMIAGGVIYGVYNGMSNDEKNDIIAGNQVDLSEHDKNQKTLDIGGNVLMGVGGGLTAIGVALVLTGYLYDFAGEDVEASTSPYMPKIDLNVTPEYQGMNLGWTF